MGLTGYLLHRPALDGGETSLYETKVFLPFAWSILFAGEDARRIGDAPWLR